MSSMSIPGRWLDQHVVGDDEPAEDSGGRPTMSDVDTMMSNAEIENIDVDDEDMPLMAIGTDMGGRRHGDASKAAGTRRLKMTRGITVDSGAADPVMPRRMVRGRGNKIRPSAASKAGVHYVSASATRIKNEGETDLHFDTEEGHSLNWTFQIAEVNKVLASVSYLVDHNHRVIFDKDMDSGKDISFIVNKKSGDSIKMRRDRNVGHRRVHHR